MKEKKRRGGEERGLKEGERKTTKFRDEKRETKEKK